MVLAGYMCIHCGVDPTVDKCKAPADKVMPRSLDELDDLIPVEVE